MAHHIGALGLHRSHGLELAAGGKHEGQIAEQEIKNALVPADLIKTLRASIRRWGALDGLQFRIARYGSRPGPQVGNARWPSAGWMAAMALAQLGLWLGLYAPLKILLPLLADLSAGHATALSKEVLMAAATLVGSLVALVANPLAGALSDRTRGRWRPRHPWILAGTLLAAATIVALPLAGSPLLLVCGKGMAKLGLNAAIAGLNGSAADRVPPAQKGGLWDWIGMAQPLGLVLGVMASTALLPNLPLAAAVMGLLLLATALPFLGTRALPLQLNPAPSSSLRSARGRLRQRLAQALAAFCHPPFAALWWARFWLYLGWPGFRPSGPAAVVCVRAAARWVWPAR